MNAAVRQLDELGVAKAMAAGELPSPQRYANILLVALRISGTGSVYRSGANEYAWRDPKHYLSDEFLERCQGLPVVLEHPKGNVLNTEEFRERIIGTVAIPFVMGDEVWGVAKIYDMPAARMLETKKLSTSPAVVLGGVDDSKVKLSDGKELLIEGKPMLLDHLAIVPLGTWDKGGPPKGVNSTYADNARSLSMQIAELKRRMPAQNDAVTREIVARDVARYAPLAQALGDSEGTPHLLGGETLLDFRARLASKFQHLDSTYKTSNLLTIGDAAAMDMVVESIYSSAEKAMKRPSGALRSVTTVEHGARVERFYGDARYTWGMFQGDHVRYGRINRNPGPK